MKKKAVISIILSLLFLAVLFVPIPMGQMKDGGTKVYSALTYKIVKWRRIYADEQFIATKVYFGADAYKSIDELFSMEESELESVMLARFKCYDGNSATVMPLENEWESMSASLISFDISELPLLGLTPESIVEVTYKGSITETFPATVNATSWRISELPRYTEYTGVWLDETTKQPCGEALCEDLSIIEIYSNCFFAREAAGEARVVKFNASLSSDWCNSDYFTCTYENLYSDSRGKLECDLLNIGESDYWENIFVAKPVIYLYPEDVTDVSVKLGFDGKLTCTYPEYDGGWKVTAYPDGTLVGVEEKEYNYLYWEGKTDTAYDFSRGFCVKGEDTAEFLERTLEKLGLTRREANEFIVYWLPLMQDNKYNVIVFQDEAYTQSARLDVTPAPDTLLRVYMAWYASDEFVDIERQELKSPVREGFTVVEWGGGKVK